MQYSSKQLQIIKVAETLFASKGFAGTSVRDIAQAANVNVSMISYYFGSKEKLIEALFDARMDESRSRMEMILQNEELTALQKVNIWFDSVLDRLMNNQCFHKIMMREQLSTERTESISDHIMGLKQRNMELMRRLVYEGQEAGIFKKDIDITLIISTLYGTINQVIATQDFLKKIENKEGMDDQEFEEQLSQRLRAHLKTIFKSIVLNDVSH